MAYCIHDGRKSQDGGSSGRTGQVFFHVAVRIFDLIDDLAEIRHARSEKSVTSIDTCSVTIRDKDLLQFTVLRDLRHKTIERALRRFEHAINHRRQCCAPSNDPRTLARGD